MSNSRKNYPTANIGIATIITVFIVVSLVTFASLSYVNANNDMSLSNRTATHNDEYYAAYNEANEQIAALGAELDTVYAAADASSDAVADAADAADTSEKSFPLSDIASEYNYEYDISDTHVLYVTVVPAVCADTELNGLTPSQYIEDNGGALYTVTRFEVVTRKDWEGDDLILPVVGG